MFSIDYVRLWVCMYVYSCRLNVVRTPISRVNACRPTVMPDGHTIYKCTYCAKEFQTFSDINRHLDFHEGSLFTDMNKN